MKSKFSTVEQQKADERFRDIMLEECANWADINALVAACDKHE